MADTDTEELRAVAGASCYSVGSNGNVYSKKSGTLRRLSPWLNSNGYEVVKLSFDDGTLKRRFVHKLVAIAFLGEPPSGKEVMHKDDNPRNNSAQNLEYGTHLENVRDMVSKGRHWSQTGSFQAPSGADHWRKKNPERGSRGESAGGAILTEEQVRKIRELYESGSSISGIARLLGVPRGATKCVCQGKTWKHVA